MATKRKAKLFRKPRRVSPPRKPSKPEPKAEPKAKAHDEAQKRHDDARRDILQQGQTGDLQQGQVTHERPITVGRAALGYPYPTDPDHPERGVTDDPSKK